MRGKEELKRQRIKFEKDQEEQKAERSEKAKTTVLRGIVVKKVTAAVVESKRGGQQGMRPHEKEKDKAEVVYINRGGHCCHTFPDCRGMVDAKVQSKETCKFRTERSEREAEEKSKEKSGGKNTELETEMAQTENSTGFKDD